MTFLGFAFIIASFLLLALERRQARPEDSDARFFQTDMVRDYGYRIDGDSDRNFSGFLTTRTCSPICRATEERTSTLQVSQLHRILECKRLEVWRRCWSASRACRIGNGRAGYGCNHFVGYRKCHSRTLITTRTVNRADLDHAGAISGLYAARTRPWLRSVVDTDDSREKIDNQGAESRPGWNYVVLTCVDVNVETAH